jgi:hypothetical protein
MTDNRKPIDQTPGHATAGAPGPGLDASRRSLTKAALLAPVIMSLPSRPVWAEGRQCTPSAFASYVAGSSLPVDLDTCGGCSPGYWHHRNACWPDGWSRTALFGETYGIDADFYASCHESTTDIGYPKYAEIVTVLNTTLAAFFPSAPDPSSALQKFARAIVAASLNAAHPSVPFPLTLGEVQAALYRALDPKPDACLAKPTASNEELSQIADDLARYWDEAHENCPLPNNGHCSDLPPLK